MSHKASFCLQQLLIHQEKQTHHTRLITSLQYTVVPSCMWSLAPSLQCNIREVVLCQGYKFTPMWDPVSDLASTNTKGGCSTEGLHKRQTVAYLYKKFYLGTLCVRHLFVLLILLLLISFPQLIIFSLQGLPWQISNISTAVPLWETTQKVYRNCRLSRGWSLMRAICTCPLVHHIQWA